MNKIFVTLFILILSINTVLARTNKLTEDYLKNKRHFAVVNPFAENLAEKIIKNTLKKEANGNFKVKFSAYTLSSLKKGIFKSIHVKGNSLEIEGINIPYLEIKSITDYNWIDYTQNPVKFKSDMTFDYNVNLSEESVNQAMNHEEYLKTITKINEIAYPLFMIQNVDIKVKRDLMYIIVEYSLPLSSSNKIKTFYVATDFNVENGKIKAKSVILDKRYRNLPIDKVTNLINLLDPLSYTLKLIDTQNCNGKIENVKIEDDIIKINGRIFVKGEK